MANHDHNAARARAFTLIEVLVVIALVSLLVSLLLPALRTAREAGRIAVCSSNQRQMAIGVTRYADDNRAFLPWSLHGPPQHSPGRNWSWPDMPLTREFGFFKFTDPNEIMNCPSSSASFLQDAGFYVYEVNYCDYLVNTCYFADMYGASTYAPYQFTYRRIDTIGRASSVIMMADGHEDDGVSDYFTLKPGSNYWDIKIGIRHNGGTNLLFFDNHVSWSRFDDITTSMISEFE